MDYSKVNIPPEKQTKIHFDPVPHKYYDDEGIIYTSVTTLIGSYKKAFNTRYWSMYTAIKNAGHKVRPDMKYNQYIYVDHIKCDIDELYQDAKFVNLVIDTKQEWKDKTVAACLRGNSIHDKLETSINESKNDYEGKTNGQIYNQNAAPNHSLSGELIIFKTDHDLKKTGIQNRYPTIYAKLAYFIGKGCTIYAEKRIYSTAYQIAGMIDVLIVKGKMFAILDWKTNKDEMMFESGYFKKFLNMKGKWEKGSTFIRTDDRLFHPINNLQDCKGIIYSLQLSLYAWLMIQWGYKLASSGLMICHLRPEREPKFIGINYYGKDIDKMMKHHFVTNVLGEKLKPNHLGIM